MESLPQIIGVVYSRNSPRAPSRPPGSGDRVRSQLEPSQAQPAQLEPAEPAQPHSERPERAPWAWVAAGLALLALGWQAAAKPKG